MYLPNKTAPHGLITKSQEDPTAMPPARVALAISIYIDVSFKKKIERSSIIIIDYNLVYIDVSFKKKNESSIIIDYNL
jgi:hypothetical protein